MVCVGSLLDTYPSHPPFAFLLLCFTFCGLVRTLWFGFGLRVFCAFCIGTLRLCCVIYILGERSFIKHSFSLFRFYLHFAFIYFVRALPFMRFILGCRPLFLHFARLFTTTTTFTLVPLPWHLRVHIHIHLHFIVRIADYYIYAHKYCHYFTKTAFARGFTGTDGRAGPALFTCGLFAVVETFTAALCPFGCPAVRALPVWFSAHAYAIQIFFSFHLLLPPFLPFDFTLRCACARSTHHHPTGIACSVPLRTSGAGIAVYGMWFMLPLLRAFMVCCYYLQFRFCTHRTFPL